VGKIL